MSSTEEQSVTNFREYLRIKTVQPQPDYEGAIKFLQSLGAELHLEMSVIMDGSTVLSCSDMLCQITDDHPMLVMTWPGSEPLLPSIVLTSHMDVVPVFADHWKVNPFSAEKFKNGDIFARGSQDMKCVGIQYLEAIRKLKARGHEPLRTIHVIFSTDEEIGSSKGMKEFVHFDEFKNLNIGCVLDEGLASPTNEFVVYNGEKVNYSVKITCPGNPGHGSQLISNTAGEKIRVVIDKMMDLRSSEKAKAESCGGCLTDVIVCNLTVLEGGVQINVLPDHLTAQFDIRVPPTVPKGTINSFLDGVCSAEGATWEYIFTPQSAAVMCVDKSDPWWAAISEAFTNLSLEYRVDIFPAATDSRFIRQRGIPAYGFSPMNNTPILLHDHNEYLNEGVFLRGIDIYVEIVSRMANVPKF